MESVLYTDQRSRMGRLSIRLAWLLPMKDSFTGSNFNSSPGCSAAMAPMWQQLAARWAVSIGEAVGCRLKTESMKLR